MNPATLLLILQLIQAGEAGIPVAVELIKAIKNAISADPGVQQAFTELNLSTEKLSEQEKTIYDEWVLANPI
jgi:hypothetical protein